ncbi:transformation system protein [Campylobacter sp. LR196d]|nr:transformation system protein [Campylobacter sp. LR196d]
MNYKLNLFFCLFLFLKADDFLSLKNEKVNFSNLENPFSNPYLEKIYKLQIQAIILNHVKIDDNWYKINDEIYSAKLKDIKENAIVLEYDNELILIKAQSNDKILIN